MRQIYLPYGSPKWEQELTEAARVGREAYVNGYTRDPDRQLCAIQSEQVRKGVYLAEIGKNIHGFCLLENFAGRYRISPNFKTLVECLEFARQWHAQDPEKRRVDITLGGSSAEGQVISDMLRYGKKTVEQG